MKIFKFLVALALLISSYSFAGVNLKNGNFYISYTDIIVPGGGRPLQIARTYNSKSTENGWFGFGWGSDFETYLTVSADGSVVVHENGAGALTRFTPKKKINPQAAAKKIISSMKKNTTMTPKIEKSLLEKLTGDAELRQLYARKYNVTTQLASGTELFSNNRGKQVLKKTSSGYKRRYSDGKVEHFNDQGKLEKIVEKSGYQITFNYEKGGLKSIKDSVGKQLFFEWYGNGKVKSIWSAKDKIATYKYRGDDLIETKDVAGNIYKISYDSNHNMTEIKYADGKTMQMSYEPKTYFISKIKDKSGEETTYKYDSNPKNPSKHYWTVVGKKSPSGKKIENRYEYEIKSKPDGEQYTYRILTVINGLKTETIYSECCSLPIKIVRGNHVTNFEYDDGLLTKKYTSTGQMVELEYHKKHKKITKVKDNNGWTSFMYDKRGNLEVAKNKAGQNVRLYYDLQGRIKKMIEKSSNNKPRTLTFVYNPQGKPIEINMSKVGKITVTYDNYGEIKNVQSKQGRKMALQVTQAFQSLLSIVKPAGVNLNL